MKKYIRVCPICGNTFETNVEHRYACKACLSKADKKEIQKILQVLSTVGWSELIDARWKNKVINNIRKWYNQQPNMIDVYAVLELILI